MDTISFTKAIADTKAQNKGIRIRRAETQKVLEIMRVKREEQRVIAYTRFERMFAGAVRDLERLVAAQDAMAEAGVELVKALGAANRASKKYLAVAARTKRNTEKAHATVERIMKFGEG